MAWEPSRREIGGARLIGCCWTIATGVGWRDVVAWLVFSEPLQPGFASVTGWAVLEVFEKVGGIEPGSVEDAGGENEAGV